MAIKGIGSEVSFEVTTPDGRTFNIRDFYAMEINTSVDSLAGSATFTIRWGYNLDWGIVANLKASVWLNRNGKKAETIMVGYVTNIERSWNADIYEVKLTVKDKTYDLIECNPLFDSSPTAIPVETSVGGGFTAQSTKTYNNIILSDFVQELCTPFGITVIDDTQHTQPLEVVEIEETETVISKIAKLCQEQAVFPHTDNHGNLVLSQFGMNFTKVNPLEGDIHSSAPLFVKGSHTVTRNDVLELTHSINMEKRFSFYKCYYSNESAVVPEAGEAPADTAEETEKQFVESVDPTVRRFRPIVIEMDTNYTGYVPAYAEWFQRIEQARSQVFSVILKDFYSSNGGLFKIGDRCNLHLSHWGIRFEGLIIGADYSLSSETGKNLVLQVVSLDNYLPQHIEPTNPETEAPVIAGTSEDPYAQLYIIGDPEAAQASMRQ